MENIFFSYNITSSMYFGLIILVIISMYLITRNAYPRKNLSFLDFFKTNDFFVFERMIGDGDKPWENIFVFKKVKKILVAKIVTGREYYVHGYQGCIFLNNKMELFEKNTVYRVKEIWRDPGSVPTWHFYFETPTIYPKLNNPTID